MFGARVQDLPDIWEELVDAGFESGHAYGKALRTVKSCVGTTWCRYGVQDSVGFAIRVENRYKGIRAPHKIKMAVSGCIRECAEAQRKDVGLIATEKGYNLYVCGNGGSKPRHAELLAGDLDEETALKYIDRFLMYYIMTADRLTRTSVWCEKLEGGIDHIRDVVVHDKLAIAAELGSACCSIWSIRTSANGRPSCAIRKSENGFGSLPTPTRPSRASKSSLSAGRAVPPIGRAKYCRSISFECSMAARSSEHQQQPEHDKSPRRDGCMSRRWLIFLDGGATIKYGQVADRRVQFRQPRPVVRLPEHVPAQKGVCVVARNLRRRWRANRKWLARCTRKHFRWKAANRCKARNIGFGHFP